MIDNVQQAMKGNGVRKQPGCGVGEIDGEAQFFQSEIIPIQGMVILRSWQKRSFLGCQNYQVSNSNPLLFDIKKKRKSFYSKGTAASELSFINLKKIVPIRTLKNLRSLLGSHC